MAGVDTQNKIYYDINIPFKAEDTDSRYHNYSRAYTNIIMNGPLISDPTNYDLTISKFKIDTETLPVYIPDMQQPQQDIQTDPIEPIHAINEFKSNSWVTMYVPRCINGALRRRLKNSAPGTNWENVPAGAFDWSTYDYTYREFSDHINNGFLYNSRRKAVTFCPNVGCVYRENDQYKKMNSLPSQPLNVNNVQETYLTNTNQAFFIYDYQTLLDRINVCMERLLEDVYLGTDIQYYTYNNDDNYRIFQRDLKRAIYFKIVDGKINLYVSEAIIKARILFKFSPDLYKYIGNGFQCIFYNYENPLFANEAEDKGDGSFFINYNPFVWRHGDRLIDNPVGAGGIFDPDDTNEQEQVTDDRLYVRREVDDNAYIYSTLTYCYSIANDSTTWYVYDAQGNENERTYLVFKQQYSTLANWNVCKALLICSSSLPIKAEYFPSLNKNLFLTHYKTDTYMSTMRNVLKENPNDEEQAVFDKTSTKILDVYYPLCTGGGDIRSCVIFDNTNIESGNKIDMLGGMDLERFDIFIKWSDIYGNVYDLYLAPGCSVDIRLCFTRKKILKDDILTGFKRIYELLEKMANTGETEEEDQSSLFDIKKEPRRKRNKVELPGVLENGLIIKP